MRGSLSEGTGILFGLLTSLLADRVGGLEGFLNVGKELVAPFLMY